MKACYNIFKNGQRVAHGGYAACRSAFKAECSAANPFNDVVLFVDHYMTPIDTY